MANGRMLETLQRHRASGEPIPHELYAELALDSHIELHAKLDELCGEGCPQAQTNKEEINKLRNRNNLTDTLTAAVTAIALYLGLRS